MGPTAPTSPTGCRFSRTSDAGYVGQVGALVSLMTRTGRNTFLDAATNTERSGASSHQIGSIHDQLRQPCPTPRMRRARPYRTLPAVALVFLPAPSSWSSMRSSRRCSSFPRGRNKSTPKINAQMAKRAMVALMATAVP
jgi:hypothetical protein